MLDLTCCWKMDVTQCFECVVILMLLVATHAQAAQNTGQLTEKAQPNGHNIMLSWRSRTALQVQIEPPSLSAMVDKSKQSLPIILATHSTKNDKAIFEYHTELANDGRKIHGTYRMECILLSDSSETEILLCKTQLMFSQPIGLNVTVKHPLSVRGQSAKAVVLPGRDGTVRTYDPEKAPTAFFDIGRTVDRTGTELAMPTVGLDFASSSFAVSSDPFSGTAFSAMSLDNDTEAHTRISLSTTHGGLTIPFQSERRTMALQLHHDSIDGTLRNFYHTIPDIKPGPAWIHDIHLNHYDYVAEAGKALEPDLDALAKRIPDEYRKHVLVCLHGYYDYLGRYTFNAKTRKLDNAWTAYDRRSRALPMSKAELHRRIRMVKERGFRCGIYFFDSLAYEDAIPEFNADWVCRDAEGNAQHWYYWQTRPDSKGHKNYLLNPAHSEVRKVFQDYTGAIVAEYGRDLDALVWDETFGARSLEDARSGGTDTTVKLGTMMVEADRAMMQLVAHVTREVQRGWKTTNPDLALLVSDNIHGTKNRHRPYCLVAHGTYQDSACRPGNWLPGGLPNYRNCLISCNWYPVSKRSHNRIAVEKYGRPQGVSNGWGDDKGPSEMPEDLLNQTIDLFLKRCRSDRIPKRYLLPQPDSNKADAGDGK